jgi:hypothetical protein
LAANPPAYAQSLADRIDYTVSVRSDAWSSSRQLDDEKGIAQIGVWSRATFDLEAAGRIVGSGWLRDQTAPDPDTPRGRLRELYWRYSQGPVELKIGRQMVVWGRADAINPTDNLSPREFTLLAPEDGDQRYGNEAAQLNVGTGIGNFIGIWFPHAASHTIPLEAQQNVSYMSDRPHRSQWAVKWDAGGDGLDGSLSYFHGFDPMPDPVLGGLGPSGVNVFLRNQPVHIIGSDFSLTRGNAVWRAEAAWMQTDSTGPRDFTHKKPQLWLVAGGEWSFDHGTTLGIQAILQHVRDFQSPDTIVNPIAREIGWRQAATSNQTSATQHGLTWRLASRWWNDTLLAEISGIVMRPSHSGLWRTKLDYAIDDHWHVQAGTDDYFGPKHSFFGQLDKNRLLYVQLRYGW